MSVYYYEIGEEFDGTGTVSVSAGTAVTGSGTSFTTEFAPGYLIGIGGEYRVVDTITDDDDLTVADAFTVTESGVQYTGVNMVPLDELGTPVLWPKSAFAAFSQQIPLGSGLVKGLGWSTGEWRWGWLSQDMRDQLRVFCDDDSGDPLNSNEVFIRTRSNESSDEYFYAAAVLIWPTGAEDKHAGRRLDFTFRFVSVTEVEVS